MTTLVRTGSRNGTSIPLLRRVGNAAPPSDAEPAARIVSSLRGYCNPLSIDTKVKTDYEKMFKSLFLELDIRVYYEPFSLLVRKSEHREITFTPDFVTDLWVGGRNVLIEPHSMRYALQSSVIKDLKKLRSFREAFGDIFYLVVASDLAGDPEDAMDEYWETPREKRGGRARENIREKLRGLLLRVDK